MFMELTVNFIMNPRTFGAFSNKIWRFSLSHEKYGQPALFWHSTAQLTIVMFCADLRREHMCMSQQLTLFKEKA